jgi:uncharacterized cupin superfamily protein
VVGRRRAGSRRLGVHGRAVPVEPDGGEPADIGPGDAAVFPRGWAGTWQIHETIRKLYVIF